MSKTINKVFIYVLNKRKSMENTLQNDIKTEKIETKYGAKIQNYKRNL